MDPNLWYWKTQGQSFVSRLRIWVNLLDPTLLLSSKPEIIKAHSLLGGGEELHEKDETAQTLALSSIHADSGAPLPLIFRPPALLPLAAPLVVGSLLPHNTVKAAVFWQSLLQNYYAGFNRANGNSSLEEISKSSMKPLVVFAGTVSITTCAGVIPQIIINRLNVWSPPVQTFLRSILPIPLSAAVASLSVFMVRSDESEKGIRVFDDSGKPVGISKAAGEKAVRETALSRAALFSTTAAVPNLLVLLLERTRFFQRNSLLVTPFRYMSMGMVLSLMIPVSLSLFPQLGTIKKEKLEAELQARAASGQLYYHRGL